MNKVFEVLAKYEKFPCKIRNKEGEILKELFELDRNFLDNQADKSDIERRYTFIHDSRKYILIEEILFSENEFIFEIEKKIGINYYLNCVNYCSR